MTSRSKGTGFPIVSFYGNPAGIAELKILKLVDSVNYLDHHGWFDRGPPQLRWKIKGSRSGSNSIFRINKP